MNRLTVGVPLRLALAFPAIFFVCATGARARVAYNDSKDAGGKPANATATASLEGSEVVDGTAHTTDADTPDLWNNADSWDWGGGPPQGYRITIDQTRIFGLTFILLKFSRPWRTFVHWTTTS